MAKKASRKEITAIKVTQWLSDWKKIEFSEESFRREPLPYFFIFKMAASDLKALSGIQKRTTDGGLPRSSDFGIQRLHDKKRSALINEFVKYGYPWSELSESKRASGDFEDLRKPGWLPTSIVVNILDPEVMRPGQTVSENDRLLIKNETEDFVKILLPEGFSGRKWKPSAEYPIEVIDGQHRLWAFENEDYSGNFELPVVAFFGLDISWQAYLFWTINIKPVRINASLAFDLYPLLRTEDWLEKFEGPSIYRETRAQELVEALWTYSENPWFQRINMLGETGKPYVSQAAWVRSLVATYIKPWESRRSSVGGLFGAKLGKNQTVLPWNRTQQAAFLIIMWRSIEQAVAASKADWAKNLRNGAQESYLLSVDAAFGSTNSLLNTDQGVRTILNITNDLFYINSDFLKLSQWQIDSDNDITVAVESLEKNKTIVGFMEKLATALSKYDWRTSNAPGLSEDQRTLKLAFRGSGGYKELRRQLLKLLVSEAEPIGRSAKEVMKALGY
ncbi:MAG: hypothetical protein IH589_10570 [Anaerolineales bacterium]|nr:hypothetical protein [Anaerolineales bacterium]